MDPSLDGGKQQRICELVFKTTMYVEMFPVNGKISKEFFLELSKLYTENIYDLKREENVAKSCQIDKSTRQKLKL